MLEWFKLESMSKLGSIFWGFEFTAQNFAVLIVEW